MWRKARRFLELREGRGLLFEASIALAAARLALAVLPFRRLAAALGEVGRESALALAPEHDETAQKIGWAVECMARHLPWDSRCLAQALAGWLLLWRRGLDATVYFGVAKDPAKPFNAHAWLRCGTRLVTGEDGHEQFQVLTCFARPTVASLANPGAKAGS